jgi:hypothetical protein
MATSRELIEQFLERANRVKLRTTNGKRTYGKQVTLPPKEQDGKTRSNSN